MSETIEKEQIDQLIEDASYMQDEAEALKYVIDQIPYDKQPPEGRSVAEILVFIDFVQKNYFRPHLEEAIENVRPVQIGSFDEFVENYDDPDEDNIGDIQSLLDHVAKHRAGVINIIKRAPVTNWSTSVYINDKKLSLFEFIQQMIRFDRAQLKKLASLVRVLGEQKQTERRIDQKREMRNPSFGKQNN